MLAEKPPQSGHEANRNTVGTGEHQVLCEVTLFRRQVVETSGCVGAGGLGDDVSEFSDPHVLEVDFRLEEIPVADRAMST